jgi:hypothetical protein
MSSQSTITPSSLVLHSAATVDDDSDELINDIVVGSRRNRSTGDSSRNITREEASEQLYRGSSRGRCNNTYNTTPKPKHPWTAYNHFCRYEQYRLRFCMDHLPITIEDISDFLLQGESCNDTREQRTIQLSFADLVMHISSKWKGLESNVRQIFLNLAAQDLIRYNNEMEKWSGNNSNQQPLAN